MGQLRVVRQYWRSDWDSQKGEGFFLCEFQKFTHDGRTIQAHPASGLIIRRNGWWDSFIATNEYYKDFFEPREDDGSGWVPVGSPVKRRCEAKQQVLLVLSQKRTA